MEAAATLVSSLGLFPSADVLGAAAETRRRGTTARAEDAARTTLRPTGQTVDDTILVGELLSAGRADRNGADADRDSVLAGSPLLRSAFANGGEVDGQRAVQTYEVQKRAGYVQELRQSTAIDLYV
ncbi:MAG: hypothetical protein U5S82_17450 [Gammaproteobacteria bacterium]|nr:hypothetical protein [Gammaproteobacteria bacterium]